MYTLIDVSNGLTPTEGTGQDTQHNPADCLRLLAQRMLSQKLALLSED